MTYGVVSPDRRQAWPKEWLPLGAIPAHGEKLALDVGRLNAHIRTSFQLVLEHKKSMQKRGLASPDDGDTLALTLAQPLTAFHGWEEPAVYQHRIALQEDSSTGRLIPVTVGRTADQLFRLILGCRHSASGVRVEDSRAVGIHGLMVGIPTMPVQNL